MTQAYPFVIPANALTVREKALEALVALFQGMGDSNAVDPYPFGWDFVQRAELDEKSWAKRFTLGVYDTSESRSVEPTVTYSRLAVALEFRCTLQVQGALGQPEDPSSMFNLILGAIQRRLYDDNSLGGLIIEMHETRNEAYLRDLEARQLSGAVFLELFYRVRTTDPRFAA